MTECPTIQELAAYVEGSPVDAGLRAHVEECGACRASLAALQGEVQTLQISISQLWFEEKVSCVDGATLERFEAGSLPADLADYVRFHLEELGCPFCQAELADQAIRTDRGEQRRRARSREKVGEATAMLLRKLRSKG